MMEKQIANPVLGPLTSTKRDALHLIQVEL